MELSEFCRIYDIRLILGLVIKDGGWHVSLRDGEIRRGGIAESLVGFGDTIPQAIGELCQKMSNQVITLRRKNYYAIPLQEVKPTSFKKLRQADLIGT